MPNRTELVFGYDANSFPVSAKCSKCGQEMPSPEQLNAVLAWQRVAWFAEQFVLHKAAKHLDSAENPAPLPTDY